MAKENFQSQDGCVDFGGDRKGRAGEAGPVEPVGSLGISSPCACACVRACVCVGCADLQELLPIQTASDEHELGQGDLGSSPRFPSSVAPCLSSHLPLTSENMGSFLAKSTTRVMAGVMILVNSLKASRSTLSPSGMETMGDWPMSSG